MRTILAAVDMSRHAQSVIARAAELASLLQNDLVILTVLDPDPMRKSNINEEHNRVGAFQRELVFKHFPREKIALESNDSSGPVYVYPGAGIRVHLKISPGNPVDVICSFAEGLRTDLVIVGNRGLGGVGGLVLGSVSERVVHKCNRTVMVVKGEAHEKSEWESIVNSQEANRSIRTR